MGVVAGSRTTGEGKREGGGRKGEREGGPFECVFSNPLGIAFHENSHSCFVVDHISGIVEIRKVTFSD